SVVITGTGFIGANAVAFGGVAASFTVNSNTQITAIAPPGSGVVDVAVTNSSGATAITAADQFTYIPTQVASVVVNGDYVAISAASESGKTVTLTTNGDSGFAVGNPIIVAGFAAPNDGYNGSWTISF